ncbi:hypothetical protein GCM10007140_02720 [Priestia taiwanensis]|uniref:Uncharacterized protein n=1 Tax=Priestia taiwanensis TaxID=1347902 RepID=A0A917AIP1_9BACI|nr:hypothetical protein GCM10007140_02720 [Priestia taiwanensis]
MQNSIDATNLPNVYATYGVILSTVSGFSITLMGFIVDTFGVKTVYIVCAIFFSLSACLSFFLTNRIGIKKEG